MSTTTLRPAPAVGIDRLVRLGLRQIASEIKQFLRSKQQVVFTMGFPVIMMVIFGSIFSGDLGGGVKFTQYFVTGMIASGLMADRLPGASHPDSDRAGPGRAQAPSRNADAARGLLRRQGRHGARDRGGWRR